MEIKVTDSTDLDQLSEIFTNPSRDENRTRYEKQYAGDAAYLLAKDDGKIVGKLYLKYTGSNESYVRGELSNCPDMENLEVVPTSRGRGIGTKLIEYAETLCKEKGYAQIGLGVGTENTRAKQLYERLGYRQVLGPFTISFPWINDSGETIQHTEEVVYLTKSLQ